MDRHAIRMLSIPTLVRDADKFDYSKSMIIQIQHHDTNTHGIVTMKDAKVIVLIMDDESSGNRGFINEQTARDVIGIAKRLSYTPPMDIFVCCYAGISRSPAIGIILNELLFHETNDAYYGFIASDMADAYTHHNRDIVRYIRHLYHNLEKDKDGKSKSMV